MSGTLVISLDFELMWGVRDHATVADYGDAILGAREAIPQMLSLFEEYGIRATWATVGLLFAKNRDEMLVHAPAIRPDYRNRALSPYPSIEAGEIGWDEADDPYHFGRSLVDRIADTPGQEIATHTYGHFYCLEPGATVDAFAADLDATIAIAADAGHMTRSIVFPRNQYSTKHLRACGERGIAAYRGNPPGFAYQPKPGTENTQVVRMWRLLDGVLPLSGHHGFAFAPTGDPPPHDVTASHFLRPPFRRLPLYGKLHVAHIGHGLEKAAREGSAYHLWWHPHNAGRRTGHWMANFRAILDRVRVLRDDHGFECRTMAECVR